MKPAQRAILLGGLLPETRALRDAMTVPATASRMSAINRLIRSLKSNGVWERLDVLYLLAAHDEQAGRLNLKNPGTFTLTANNSPTFTADRGFAGDGVSMYLSSTYNPTTFLGQLTINDALAGVWIHQANTTAAGTYFSLTSTRLTGNAGPTLELYRVNDATASSTTLAPGAGHLAASRAAAGTKDVWKNGALVRSDSVASTALSSAMTLLAAAAAANPSNARLSAAYAGGALTAAQMAEMHTALQAYMQTVGAA